MIEINTIGRYFRREYNTDVYKIPISISGFTCPNIDGKVAFGGCTFCENDSFSPNLTKKKDKFKLSLDTDYNPILDIQLKELQEQFLKTKKRLQKFGAKKFIVYFQSYTNTYAPLDTLKALYEKALSFKDVIGLSIGTRTDSINEDILKYLQELNSNYKEIWIEYGIQSFFDETLKKINRGHDSENIIKWIKKTKEKDIKICAHLIYGLPDETEEMMLQTLQKTIDLDVDSIKFHPLYITKNTILASKYQKGLFKPISKDSYIEVLIKSLEILTKEKPDIIIQRITAGDSLLLTPNWCKNKNLLINEIRKRLKEKGMIY